MNTSAQTVRWWKASSPNTAVASPMVTITIDGRDIEAPEGASLLSAATAAGIYIPSLLSLIHI